MFYGATERGSHLHPRVQYSLTRPDQPDRRVALHRRDTTELLAEELRRLNPDEVYGETLASLVSGARR